MFGKFALENSVSAVFEVNVMRYVICKSEELVTRMSEGQIYFRNSGNFYFRTIGQLYEFIFNLVFFI